MEYFRDYKYPNGWTKSRLYEVFLTYRHFGIPVHRYEMHIEFVKIDENNREKNCAWFRDDDGRLIVAGLEFEDRGARLAITEQGFEFVGESQAHRRVKVFISYASQDLPAAKRLFAELKGAGFEPWLDKECLLPGERWKTGIDRAIRGSHYFIALLSSNSVARRGYVQKEVYDALEILKQVPESAIFLIPARLDDCRPSHAALEELHWVNLFPECEWENGFKKIVRVLRT